MLGGLELFASQHAYCKAEKQAPIVAMPLSVHEMSLGFKRIPLPGPDDQSENGTSDVVKLTFDNGAHTPSVESRRIGIFCGISNLQALALEHGTLAGAYGFEERCIYGSRTVLSLIRINKRPLPKGDDSFSTYWKSYGIKL